MALSQSMNRPTRASVSGEWVWPALNLVALVAVIAVNALANILPINGQTTGELADQNSVVIQPAGWAFRVWSLIYLGLIAYVVYSLFPAGRASERLRQVGPWFAISCLANIAWILLWHYEQIALSVAAMLTILFSLIMVYTRLGVGQARPAFAERLCVHVPFGLYLGWIAVATVVNVAVFLQDAGWDGVGVSTVTWAAVMTAVAGLLATAVAWRRADPAYVAVSVWAFAAIVAKNPDSSRIAVAAALATIFSVTALLYRLTINRRSARAEPAP